MVGFGVSFDELPFGEDGSGSDEWDEVGYVDQYGRGSAALGTTKMDAPPPQVVLSPSVLLY